MKNSNSSEITLTRYIRPDQFKKMDLYIELHNQWIEKLNQQLDIFDEVPLIAPGDYETLIQNMLTNGFIELEFNIKNMSSILQLTEVIA